METHRRLDSELELLRDRVLVLGGEAEIALGRAMRALTARDGDEARAVLAHDDAVDRLELEVDRLCVDILALRQPAARDLRFVISVAKVAPVLERIADHACNIARAALDLNEEPELRPPVDLARMADHVAAMLRAALDSFTSGDADSARRTIRDDDAVDAMYEHSFRALIERMAADPSSTPRAARLLFVAKHLERVGDYVTDLCELTVYMAEAAVIKHNYSETMKEER